MQKLVKLKILDGLDSDSVHGHMTAVQLEHIRGVTSCSRLKYASTWGCKHLSLFEKKNRLLQE